MFGLTNESVVFSIESMRSIWRTLDPRLVRDVALVCAADAFVGLSFGAITVSAGLPFWLPMLLSLVVFAGAAQFMFVGLVVSGGNLVAAVLAGLLVNARHLPFGFAVADVLGGHRLGRVLGSHLLIDESVAFVLAQSDLRKRRQAYWICGIGLFVCWNLGVLLGAFGGTRIADTDALGLDAAFPAVLLALVLSSLRDRSTLLSVIIGALVALLSTPILPPGLPVLLGLLGVLAAVRSRTSRKVVP